MKFPKVIIVDFGSQYTLLIAKQVRKLRVYCEVISPENLLSYLNKDHTDDGHIFGIILSGGPHTASERSDHLDLITYLLKTFPLPILGICYGAQLIGLSQGARVCSSEEGEFGLHELSTRSPELQNPLCLNIPPTHKVWQSHRDSIYLTEKVSTMNIISELKNKVEIFQLKGRPIYGLQYHPEVTHTPYGSLILDNFIRISRVPREWSSQHFIEQIIPDLRSQLQSPTDEKVMVACSGGVDSTVTAALIQRAVGNRMLGIFVDPGLLRLDEYSQVLEGYKRSGLNVIGIDAKERFYEALIGITDPEEKRKIIGNLFIDIFKDYAPNATWLAQGTIYPDVIESTGGIKSHHNVGGLPEKLNLKLIEPLRLLFKDDVRDLGRMLNIDKAILNRHPFPGPGLAIRILGQVTPEKVDILQQADAIFMSELKESGHYESIWQAGVVLLDCKAVGVQGDNRTYQYVVALRAVESTNAMTASVYSFPISFLTRVSTRIINQVDSINRVTYDVTTKPPGTIEWL